MTEENELYTDYALQIFSSYVSQDIDSMSSVLESFKNDGKNIDHMFLPGVIYGLMYHMRTMLELFSLYSKAPIDLLLSSYAMDYAIAREDLLDNNVLNVAKSREEINKLIQYLQDVENFGDDDF